VGPILGVILTLALSGGSISQGVVLLAAYSAGLAIPFLIASVQIGLVVTVLRKYGKTMHYVEVGMGVVMIIVGVLLLLGRFEQMAQFGSFLGIYDEIALGRWLLIAVGALLLLGLAPAYIAYRKGRSFLTWWLFGFALFPVALPLAFLIKPELPEPEPAH
jgi:thiol:disulfide interchange protein